MKQTVATKTINLKSDLIVIGAGGGGLAAAVTAAEKGARVTVLEKRAVPGGATIFAEGPFAAESPTQKRLNVTCTKDELFNIQMYFNHWTLNAKQVREIINKSGDTIRWLEEKGIEFLLPMMVPNQSPLEWHVPPKGTCLEIIETFMKDCEQSGVDVLFNTSAKKIILDKSGKVSGVIAKAGNKEITLKTNAVIIATGGYGGNERLIKKYNPTFNLKNIRVNMLKNMHNGDGLRLAFEIGADSDGLGKLILHGPVSSARPAFGLAIEANCVWVNKNGERFIQESASFSPFESVNGVVRQPDQVCFSMFDEGLKQYFQKNGMEKPSRGTLHAQKMKTDWDVAFKKEAAEGRMAISDSWDGIAKWIGVKPGVLKATIDEYNASCDKKHDDQFAKNPKNLRAFRTPPYYAVKCTPGILSTFGGIKTNHRMEVIDKTDNPIKGLYAVGNDAAGGFCGSTYNVRLAGAGCGFAFNSGRIAGENATKYVIGK